VRPNGRIVLAATPRNQSHEAVRVNHISRQGNNVFLENKRNFASLTGISECTPHPRAAGAPFGGFIVSYGNLYGGSYGTDSGYSYPPNNKSYAVEDLEVNRRPVLLSPAAVHMGSCTPLVNDLRVIKPGRDAAEKQGTSRTVMKKNYCRYFSSQCEDDTISGSRTDVGDFGPSCTAIEIATKNISVKGSLAGTPHDVAAVMHLFSKSMVRVPAPRVIPWYMHRRESREVLNSPEHVENQLIAAFHDDDNEVLNVIQFEPDAREASSDEFHIFEDKHVEVCATQGTSSTSTRGETQKALEMLTGDATVKRSVKSVMLEQKEVERHAHTTSTMMGFACSERIQCYSEMDQVEQFLIRLGRDVPKSLE
jgi:hypothetical protein